MLRAVGAGLGVVEREVHPRLERHGASGRGEAPGEQQERGAVHAPMIRQAPGRSRDAVAEGA